MVSPQFVPSTDVVSAVPAALFLLPIVAGAVVLAAGRRQHRFCQLTGEKPPEAWHQMISRGADWITRKRTSSTKDVLHAGLLPAGFSAEHLGNNDFYYWDDFWGVAGYEAAAALFETAGMAEQARSWRAEAPSLAVSGSP